MTRRRKNRRIGLSGEGSHPATSCFKKTHTGRTRRGHHSTGAQAVTQLTLGHNTTWKGDPPDIFPKPCGKRPGELHHNTLWAFHNNPLPRNSISGRCRSKVCPWHNTSCPSRNNRAWHQPRSKHFSVGNRQVSGHNSLWPNSLRIEGWEKADQQPGATRQEIW